MKIAFLGAVVFSLMLTSIPVPRESASLPEPIAQLDALLAGKWKIDVTLPGEPGKPPIQAGKGEERFYAGPGGRSFIEDYHSTGAEGETSGLGVLWWSAEKKAYEVLWCDSGSPEGCARVKGGARWEGSDLVARTNEIRQGKKVDMKEVFARTSKESFTQAISEAVEGEQWKVVVTIQATRAK